MATIIDGYNLLHLCGFLPRGIGPGTLQRARTALLNQLAAALDPEEARRTTVVFDAKDAPPDLPHRQDHRGITVYYAAEHEDADALIEQLILADSAPRRLTVVSSDHRIQRAARRRRARAIDSDQWYAGLIRRRYQRDRSAEPVEAERDVALSPAEVQRWLSEFGGAEGRRAPPADMSEPNGAAHNSHDNTPRGGSCDGAPVDKRRADTPQRGSRAETPRDDDREKIAPAEQDPFNPFPPGYAEDLLEDEQLDQ